MNQYPYLTTYTPYLCGCYYYDTYVVTWQQRIKKYLPLVDSEAHSTILNTTSKTVLKQTFTNPSSEVAIKECIYTFPLYDGVSVVGFTCKIGSRILTGLVKEKTKAKEIFDQAVAKGETAGLLEQAPEASDVFSTKLGNIPAGKSVIVEITYIGELKHHETEGIRFTIPTSIAPRYGQSPNNALAGPQAQPDGEIKITVDINMPEGSFIKGVQSPSHPIAVSMGALSTAANADPTMNKASATLSLGSSALEKDFILIVQSKDIGIPKAILETHPTIPHHRAIMATLVPKFSLPPSRPEIVFVADRSGSMRGNIPMLISAMKVFLKSIPIGVKFNICSFGNKASFLWKQSKSYSSDTLQEATSHVEGFDANMGGTETYNAIQKTVEKRFTDIPLEIILLTDGDIWRQEELFNYVNRQVKETNGKIRIFPLGIGNGVSSALIEGLARAGNGFSQSVQNGERLDNSVVRMLRGALTPHITDYTLEVKYEKEDDDFELIDKVTEGLKVLLSDIDSTQPEPQAPKPTISLFDSTVDPEKEDVKMTDVDYLPKVPYPKLLQAPHQIPSLFAFSRTSVYLLMSPDTIQRNPTAVVLHATSAHGPLELEIPIEVLSTPGQTIHQLAAKKAVQDLEEGRSWIFNAKDQAGVLVKDRYPSRFDDLVQKEAVRLGEKFQVAGKWCSFVAVEANEVEIMAKQGSRRAEQDGVDGSGDVCSLDFGSPASGDVLQEFDFDSFLHQDQSTPVSTASLGSSPASASFSPVSPFCSAPSPQRLQDSQMGLMMLEQQNKKRLVMARQEPINTGAAPFNMGAAPPQYQSLQQPQQSPRAAFGSPPSSAFGAMQQQVNPLGHQHSVSAAKSSSLFGAAPTAQQSSTTRNQFLFGSSSATPAIQQTQHAQLARHQEGKLYSHLSNYQNPFGSVPATAPTSGGLFGAPASRGGGSGGLRRGTALKSNDENAYMKLATQTSKDPSVGRSSSNLFGGMASNAPPPPTPQVHMATDMSFASTRSADPQVEAFSSTTPRKMPLIAGPFGFTNPIFNKSSAPVTEDWSTKSVSDKVLALISLQDFAGSWSDNTSTEISRIMGCKVPKAPKGINQKAWTTLLLVSYLETNCADEEGTWGLVVEKARDFLRSGCTWTAGVKMEDAEKQAKAFWGA